MVGVCVVTYNQEQYIAQAIDSVLMQETESETIHLYIGNDCSSDRTTSICEDYAKRYPDTITLLNNQKNLGLVKNTLNVLTKIKNDGCEFVAMLDGDDYWTDSKKIHKQLEILGNNPRSGFVHTNISLLLNGNFLQPRDMGFPPTGNVFDDMGHFSIANCIVLFRSFLLDAVDFKELEDEGFLSLDGVMYTLFSAMTEFSYLPDVTAVWRRGHNSVSNTKDEQKQIAYLENERKMWSYLDCKFPGRYAYSEEGWQQYYNYKLLNIAYNFNDYPLAHSLIRQPMSDTNFKGSVKRICASNRLLFKLWCLLKSQRAKSSLSH